MDILKKIGKDFLKGENITLITTIVFVVIALILQRFNLATSELISSITLAMLGLIATSFLFLRYRIQEIVDTSNQRIDAPNTVTLLKRFPHKLDDYLRKSDEIIMLGITLRKTTFNHDDVFAERARNGLKIRAMITNLYSPLINNEQLIFRFSRAENQKEFFNTFEAILKIYERIRTEAHDPEVIQVRLLDIIPPFSAYIFPNHENGIAFVQMYAHRAPVGKSPNFIVTGRENPEWFDNINILYSKLWEDGVDYFAEGE